MELDLFSLECNEVSSSEFWGVCEFGMALISLSFNAQSYVSCFAGELVWYVLHWKLLPPGWSLVLVWVWSLLGELFSINFPWNQEFSDVLKFWS